MMEQKIISKLVKNPKINEKITEVVNKVNEEILQAENLDLEDEEEEDNKDLEELEKSDKFVKIKENEYKYQNEIPMDPSEIIITPKTTQNLKDDKLN